MTLQYFICRFTVKNFLINSTMQFFIRFNAFQSFSTNTILNASFQFFNSSSYCFLNFFIVSFYHISQSFFICSYCISQSFLIIFHCFLKCFLICNYCIFNSLLICSNLACKLFFGIVNVLFKSSFIVFQLSFCFPQLNFSSIEFNRKFFFGKFNIFLNQSFVFNCFFFNFFRITNKCCYIVRIFLELSPCTLNVFKSNVARFIGGATRSIRISRTRNYTTIVNTVNNICNLFRSKLFICRQKEINFFKHF